MQEYVDISMTRMLCCNSTQGANLSYPKLPKFLTWREQWRQYDLITHAMEHPDWPDDTQSHHNRNVL